MFLLFSPGLLGRFYEYVVIALAVFFVLLFAVGPVMAILVLVCDEEEKKKRAEDDRI